MSSDVRKILGLVVADVAVGLWLKSVHLSTAQIGSTLIFLTIIGGTLTYWARRLSFAFVGIAVLLGLRLLDIPHLIEYAGLDIILFLVGMMTVIGFLEERRFFEHVIEELINRVGTKARRVVVVLMVASFVSAALVDEVTSVLFMLSALLHLTNKHKVNPIPFVMMVVFATNIGSSATVVGNPIGVMIALRAGLTFEDFLRWAAPLSALCMAVTVPLCLWLFKRPIKELGHAMREHRTKTHPEAVEVTPISPKALRTCWWLFGVTVALLVVHSQIEHALGLEKNTMLLGTALLAAGVALWLSGDQARELVEKRIDWWTLSFFVVLFASVGTLKLTGVTTELANWVMRVAAGRVEVLLALITGASALLTAFLDNVLAVATFIPVMGDLTRAGIHTTPLWWGLLFGGTLFGNMTIIGSTANIVAIGLLERKKLGSISFMAWLWPGLLVSVVTLAIALTGIWLQMPVMPR
ncbi:MAG: hypothetical protein HY597_03905 [Candidatus Omnitrophica bacterium]|nr:hypothetical protein [Candidatus Omnitrophota bacterium]